MPHTTSRRRVVAGAGTLAALSIAGCIGGGTDDDTGGSGDIGDPAQSVEVRMSSVPRIRVEPSLVHVEPGGTVTWVGEGVRNGVASYHPDTHGPLRMPEAAEPFVSDVIRAESRFKVTLEREGIYDYVDPTTTCGSHEAIGAVGRIVVGQPDLARQPAIAHDNGALPSQATTVMDAHDEACREILG